MCVGVCVCSCIPSQGAVHFPGLLIFKDCIKHPQALGRHALGINVFEGHTLPHEDVETMIRGGHLVESEQRIGPKRATVPGVRPVCV